MMSPGFWVNSIHFMQKQLNRFKVRALCAIAAGLFTVNAAWAVDPFTVRDIRVEGLQRVEPGTIFASLPFRVGETYNDDKGSTAIRALFGLGLFKDVRLEVCLLYTSDAADDLLCVDLGG